MRESGWSILSVDGKTYTVLIGIVVTKKTVKRVVLDDLKNKLWMKIRTPTGDAASVHSEIYRSLGLSATLNSF